MGTERAGMTRSTAPRVWMEPGVAAKHAGYPEVFGGRQHSRYRVSSHAASSEARIVHQGIHDPIDRQVIFHVLTVKHCMKKKRYKESHNV